MKCCANNNDNANNDSACSKTVDSSSARLIRCQNIYGIVQIFIHAVREEKK